MSHAHSHENTVPRPALVLAGALVAITVALTGLVRVGVLPREAVPAVERAKEGVTPLPCGISSLPIAPMVPWWCRTAIAGQRSPCSSAKTTAAVSCAG
jgi:hypothetical protein